MADDFDDQDTASKIWDASETPSGTDASDRSQPHHETERLISALGRLEPLLRSVDRKLSSQRSVRSDADASGESERARPSRLPLGMILIGAGVGVFVSAASFVARIGTISPDGIPQLTWVNLLFGTSAALLVWGFFLLRRGHRAKRGSRRRKILGGK